MPAQIRNGADCEGCGFFFFDPQSIRVVESERITHRHAETGQHPAHGLTIRDFFSCENLLSESAGILGIDIDVAVEQSTP